MPALACVASTAVLVPVVHRVAWIVWWEQARKKEKKEARKEARKEDEQEQ